MGDAAYEVFQDGPAYKVQITRLGNFVQEAEGFSSREDAESWIARWAARCSESRATAPDNFASPTRGEVVTGTPERPGIPGACKAVVISLVPLAR
jgi:hypothetical protein